MTAYVYAGVKELIIPFCTWNGIIDIGLHITVYAFVSSIIFSHWRPRPKVIISRGKFVISAMN